MVRDHPILTIASKARSSTDSLWSNPFQVVTIVSINITVNTITNGIITTSVLILLNLVRMYNSENVENHNTKN